MSVGNNRIFTLELLTLNRVQFADEDNMMLQAVAATRQWWIMRRLVMGKFKARGLFQWNENSVRGKFNCQSIDR